MRTHRVVDVTDWDRLGDAVAARGHGRGNVLHLPVLSEQAPSGLDPVALCRTVVTVLVVQENVFNVPSSLGVTVLLAGPARRSITRVTQAPSPGQLQLTPVL